MSLAAVQLLIDSFVRDDNGRLSAVDRDEAIKLALEQYSQDRPRATVEDVASGAGGNTLPLPTLWEADFSNLSVIEYPIGEVPPSIVGTDRWQMYQSPSGFVIQLADSLPAAVNARLTYGRRHTLTSAADTIPVKDREAFCKAAAAILCDQLAAIYSNNSDPTIQADSVDHKSQAADYRSLANKYRKDYQNTLGVDEKRSVAAGVVVPLRPLNSLGQDRLQHGRMRLL